MVHVATSLLVSLDVFNAIDCHIADLNNPFLERKVWQP